MSVYKPKKSRFWQYDFVFQNRRYHGSTCQESRRGALKVESARREAVSLAAARSPSGRDPAPEPEAIPTLDVAANEWWESVGKGLGKPATEKARLNRLANGVALVGASKLVTEIRTADIARAIAKRRGKLTRYVKRPPSNATVNRDVIDVVRPVIKRACKIADVAAPPVAWGELDLDEPKPKPRDFTNDQIEAVYDALPHWWHDFARFQARYGPRVSEMFFSLADIDIDGRQVLLRNRKGDDDHYLQLLDADVAMLAARIGRARAAKLDTPWFKERKSGKLVALHYGGALKAIGAAMRTSGLHEARGAKGSHDLRHHAAMTFLRGSKNLRATQALLGHVSIQSTLVYAHVLKDDVRAALEAIYQNSPEPVAEVVEKPEEKQSSKL